MKPIPEPSISKDASIEASLPDESGLIKSSQPRSPHANRRVNSGGVHQVYPWLLAISTAIAILFGLMYINKPVVITSHNTKAIDARKDISVSKKATSDGQLMPTSDVLPGDSSANHSSDFPQDARNLNTAPVYSQFEETNMRMQHILTATTEDGSITRIDLEAPVLYRSRNLRWTAAELSQAQDLLVKLMEYQNKSRQLRVDGEKLLKDWNALIGSTIPASRLRADSPSLPNNQMNARADSTPNGSETREAVEIQPRKKP